MTAIVSFPLPPAAQARLAARDDAVLAAREILRSEAPHTRATIRDACHALMTYGDQWDWVEAYNVLRSIDQPSINHRSTIDRPPYSAGTGMIRAELVDIAGLLVIVAVALMVYLAGGA